MIYRFDDMDKRSNETTKDIQEWCDENLTDGEILFGETTLCIVSEIDAMAFELRWI